ncbi:MAG: hypothetical protein IJI83_00640 [Oscillospiraceae bacterium]|nr:hypothetical protein [Oscillospiraceae bacterium]
MDKLKKKNLLFAGFLAGAVVIAISLGLEARTDISYTPYNGDWQHYNMFRRLLDGQTPFVDFPLVLGQAVLYTNSLVLRIIGNSFANSIFSTTFVGWMAGFFLFGALLYLFMDDKESAVGGSLAMMMSILLFAPVQSLGIIANNPVLSGFFSIMDRVFSKFAVLYLPGNSSRPTRMAVIGVYIVLFSLIYHRLKWEKKTFWKEAVIFGAIGGFMILWANDYGSASYVGASFCFFLLMVKKHGWLTSLKATLVYIITTLAVVICLMFMVTKGNVGSWFRQTFSITGFLWWYDGVFFDRKRLGFWEYPPFSGEHRFPILLCLVALAYWICILFTSKDREKTSVGHVMLLTTSFVFLYLNLFSNGYEEQYANIFIVYTIMATSAIVLKAANRVKGSDIAHAFLKKGAVAAGALVIAIAVAYSANSIRYAVVNSEKTYAYVEALGGNCYEWYEDLNMAYERIGDASLFSTYGSALEVMKGTRQPSRYDYITHVFGEDARKEYIEVFHSVKPDYISILNRDFTRWEAWACNANWFFYREFIENYQYSFSNTFCRYLKRTSESNTIDTDVNVEIIQTGDSEVTVRLQSSETEKILIADVLISYDSQLQGGIKRWLTVNRLVSVTGTSEYLYPRENFDAWFLPNSADEYAIPIMIEKGMGEITLSVHPDDCASLSVSRVYVNKVCDFEKIFG